MSGKDTSEEKTLPPSNRKLKELRKKGDIPKSPDMVSGVTTSAGFMFLWFTAYTFVQRFQASFATILERDTEDFDFAAIHAVKMLILNLGVIVAVLFGIVISLTILANMIANKGFLFSIAKMKFDLSKLNPVEGLKKLFSLKALVDLTQKMLKVFLFLSLSTVIVGYNVQSAFHITSCGNTCFSSLFSILSGFVLLIAVVIFLAFGFADVPIQRWLFMRQQKMTKTEAKRDRREEEGSPELRRYQRNLRHEMLRGSAQQQPEQATIFIEGSGAAVGVRFIMNETPIPTIVCKGRRDLSDDLLATAMSSGKPIYFDEDLAEGMYLKHEIGDALKDAFFSPFITALQTTKLV